MIYTGTAIYRGETLPLLKKVITVANKHVPGLQGPMYVCMYVCRPMYNIQGFVFCCFFPSDAFSEASNNLHKCNHYYMKCSCIITL